jgi:hypothetical protein
MTKNLLQHKGVKYLRSIHDAIHPGKIIAQVDVYSVIEAFGVTCPGRQQAIKKLLCCGNRGKGSQLDDLIGAEAALSRAIELQKTREKETDRNRHKETEENRHKFDNADDERYLQAKEHDMQIPKDGD